jgi:hypothetical protein
MMFQRQNNPLFRLITVLCFLSLSSCYQSLYILPPLSNDKPEFQFQRQGAGAGAGALVSAEFRRILLAE